MYAHTHVHALVSWCDSYMYMYMYMYITDYLLLCRLLEVMTNRIIDIHPVDKPVSDLNSQNMFRVEVSHMKCYYCSVPSKCPWVLKHNSQFWPTWVLFIRDINCIHLYGSCYINPLKFGTWALTWEWPLARDTTVLGTMYVLCEFWPIYTHISIHAGDSQGGVTSKSQ